MPDRHACRREAGDADLRGRRLTVTFGADPATLTGGPRARPCGAGSTSAHTGGLPGAERRCHRPRERSGASRRVRGDHGAQRSRRLHHTPVDHDSLRAFNRSFARWARQRHMRPRPPRRRDASPISSPVSVACTRRASIRSTTALTTTAAARSRSSRSPRRCTRGGRAAVDSLRLAHRRRRGSARLAVVHRPPHRPDRLDRGRDRRGHDRPRRRRLPRHHGRRSRPISRWWG